MNGMDRICYVIGAMSPKGEKISQKADDLVIAADAGLRYVKEYGLLPDLAVGDFDSLGDFNLAGCEVIRHPAEKDDTDLMLAIKIGLDRGYRLFLLLGAMGGRADHAYAVYQCLAYLEVHHAHGYLYSDGMAVTRLTDGSLKLTAHGDGLLSVFAVDGAAAGVSLEGVYYPLNNVCLTPTFPLGVSNQITRETAFVSVQKGSLLVFWSAKNDFIYETEKKRRKGH